MVSAVRLAAVSRAAPSALSKRGLRRRDVRRMWMLPWWVGVRSMADRDPVRPARSHGIYGSVERD
ncbi:hypothetical protein GCM10009687_36790 [Asanoa iriomotensis]|uniref:Uncharacterized protein n=1 Tax=Asanoa iriomotensis TaxID=234613 RepID=A0ABQ4C7L0_9ACTN|nr:hypothetical protein Air01nite_43950 [Asanoa iriomotensis]